MTLRINLLLMVFTVGITLSVFSNDVWGSKWVEFYDDEGTTHFYDESSIRKTSHILKVWTWTTYSSGKERDQFVKSLSDYYGNHNFVSMTNKKILIEIKCKQHLYRVISSTYYDGDGIALYVRNDPSEWMNMVPDSLAIMLKEIVCK